MEKEENQETLEGQNSTESLNSLSNEGKQETQKDPEKLDDPEELDDPDQNEINTFDDSDASDFDKFFGITKYGSTIRTEIISGLVSFLATCYILALNPTLILLNIQDPNGYMWSSIFISTAIVSIIGTLLMALFAKMPFVQAPGLGLNSMFNLLMCGALVPKSFFSYGSVALLVLISGILFLVVSIIPIGKDKDTHQWIILRERIFEDIPLTIKKSITVGIGLFIAFIGFQNSHIIIDSSSTLVTLVSLKSSESWKKGGPAREAIVALFGLLIITFLSHFSVKGSFIIGILASTLLAWPLGVTSVDVFTQKDAWKFWKHFEHYFQAPSKGGVFGSPFREVTFPPKTTISSIIIVITFCIIDMFDTIGTTVGCAANANLVNSEGKPNNYDKVIISDSIATIVGAIFGSSTVTTFVESGSGIAAGGKTGLTSLTVAALFFLSIFILPIFRFIPSAACAPALIYVGILMMSNVTSINFKNPLNAVSSFLTIILMPLGYSITTGIGMGVLSYVILHFLDWLIKLIMLKLKKEKEIPPLNISITLLIIFILFIIYFFVPTSF